MKRITLIIAAMFAMAQINAATTDAAVNNESATATQAADVVDQNEESIVHLPFAKKDEDQKHWSITPSGFYMGLGVKNGLDIINNTFEVGLLNVIAVNYNSLHGQNVSLGVGIHHRSYSFKRPNMLARGENSQIVFVDTYPTEAGDAIKKRSSNLNLWAVEFPLMFKQRIVKKLDITVAGILNWNVFARVDNHYEMNKIESETRFKNLKQNKVNFDVMGALTWDDLGIYCRYTPGKFFKDGFGPKINNTWTLGLFLAL